LLSPHKRSFETVSPPADKALYNTSSYLQNNGDLPQYQVLSGFIKLREKFFSKISLKFLNSTRMETGSALLFISILVKTNLVFLNNHLFVDYCWSKDCDVIKAVKPLQLHIKCQK